MALRGPLSPNTLLPTRLWDLGTLGCSRREPPHQCPFPGGLPSRGQGEPGPGSPRQGYTVGREMGGGGEEAGTGVGYSHCRQGMGRGNGVCPGDPRVSGMVA